MKICKYCKKPISNEAVWNPDSEGNGYHHACLCEMEFKSRDRRIYNKGKADVLDKIRAEIEQLIGERNLDDYDFCSGLICARKIIDKYKAESEDKRDE